MKTTASSIDPTTPSGFRAARIALGFTHPRQFAEFIHANEKTVKRWETGDVPPHPAAASALRWMLEGYRPEGWREDQSGDAFREARVALGLSRSGVASVLDIEDHVIALWEDGDGPPKFVWLIMDWFRQGFRPAEWPSAAAKGDLAAELPTG